MKIIGFKPQRFREWKIVLDEELKRASLFELLTHMALVAFKGLPHLGRNRRLWRDKMRTCLKCPIFDPSLHRCGPGGSPLGCRCYTPFLALFKTTCYADEHLPEEHIGWTTNLLQESRKR